MEYVIGIDSGGSHIVIQAINLKGKELFEFTSVGCGNILIDYSATLEQIKKLIFKVDGNLSLSFCKVIVIGIAGLSNSKCTSKFKEEIFNCFHLPVVLMTDASLGMWNVLSGEDGTLAIAGTGSAVFAKSRNKIDRVGGWGYLIGDEGSGYDIARRTVKFITSSVDHHLKNDFTDLFLQKSGFDEVSDLISWIYSNDRDQIATLAKVTAEIAPTNSQALTIINNAANSLAKQVIILLKRNPKNLLIGESGSVLTMNTIYRKKFETEIKSFSPKMRFVISSKNNSYGSYFWYKYNKENIEL